MLKSTSHSTFPIKILKSGNSAADDKYFCRFRQIALLRRRRRRRRRHRQILFKPRTWRRGWEEKFRHSASIQSTCFYHQGHLRGGWRGFSRWFHSCAPVWVLWPGGRWEGERVGGKDSERGRKRIDWERGRERVSLAYIFCFISRRVRVPWAHPVSLTWHTGNRRNCLSHSRNQMMRTGSGTQARGSR